MAIYEITPDQITEIRETSFEEAGLRERTDLQRLLRDRIEIICPETLIVAEEFGEWQESRRRIDLLGVDKKADLVVIELKRTEEGGHMELQAIRYAAMVTAMTFEKTVDVFGRYLRQTNQDKDPQATLLEFLEWDEPDEERFGQDVRIVLASADFSRELTTSVMWLNDKDLDIRCVRVKPYQDNDRVLINVEQVIPLPEAADYQIQIKEKRRKEKNASNVDFTRFDVSIGEEIFGSLWKRNAILIVVKHLCRAGIDPEKIRELIDWPKRASIWHTVEGRVDGQGFVDAALEIAEADGIRFDPRRWHCRSENLIYANEKTYAFSNQWGGESWHRAMERLKTAFPESQIDFRPVR